MQEHWVNMARIYRVLDNFQFVFFCVVEVTEFCEFFYKRFVSHFFGDYGFCFLNFWNCVLGNGYMFRFTIATGIH